MKFKPTFNHENTHDTYVGHRILNPRIKDQYQERIYSQLQTNPMWAS